MDIVFIMGGLGNQMFQYAFYKKLKKLHMRDAYVILHNITQHQGYELEKIFSLSPLILPKNWFHTLCSSRHLIIRIIRKIARTLHILYCSSSHACTYHPELLKKRFGVSLYMGYWQSEKYFSDIAEELRKEFTFPPLTDAQNIAVLDSTCGKNRVSMHIRRGDYLKIGAALADSYQISYCHNAITYMQNHVKNPVFLIFSDDIDWCKKHIIAPPPGEKVTLSL